jgi:hypothetical protein
MHSVAAKLQVYLGSLRKRRMPIRTRADGCALQSPRLGTSQKSAIIFHRHRYNIRRAGHTAQHSDWLHVLDYLHTYRSGWLTTVDCPLLKCPIAVPTSPQSCVTCASTMSSGFSEWQDTHK